jgi:hypothetical protein
MQDSFNRQYLGPVGGEIARAPGLRAARSFGRGLHLLIFVVCMCLLLTGSTAKLASDRAKIEIKQVRPMLLSTFCDVMLLAHG